MIPHSVLDLSPIVEGGTVADALARTVDLARRAEEFGYSRFWLAEHQNMPGLACAATAILIGQAGAATSRIRVGAGGIMLPNWAPLQVAEQFGTLAALFPGRVDLGLGRAPGTDRAAAHALRRTLHSNPDDFPNDVLELMAYLYEPEPHQQVRAVPGAGMASEMELWILGSSTFGAHVAAELGLPYAFASHFAPAQLFEALEVYRARFQPSERLARPHVMLGVNIVAAGTDDEAQFLASSGRQAFASLRSGRPIPLPPPSREWSRASAEPSDPAQRARVSFVGAAASVQSGLEEFVSRTQPDELIVVSHIHEHAARVRSYEIAAGILDRMTLG